MLFQGHVTSLVTVWHPRCHFLWGYSCTESLCRAIFEIMDDKHIRVTTLTFQGYMASLVTWPIDLPYAISYWCPIGTKPLSSTNFEIFGHQNTHTQTHATSDFILSVQCNVLHWTDNIQFSSYPSRCQSADWNLSQTQSHNSEWT